MAIALVQSAQHSAGSGDPTVTFPATTAGNFQLAVVCANVSGVGAPTAPTGWTLAGAYWENFPTNDSGGWVAVFCRANCPGGSTSQDFGAITAGGGGTVLYGEFSGLPPTSSADGALVGANGTAASSVTVNGNVPAESGELVVAFVSTNFDFDTANPTCTGFALLQAQQSGSVQAGAALWTTGGAGAPSAALAWTNSSGTGTHDYVAGVVQFTVAAAGAGASFNFVSVFAGRD